MSREPAQLRVDWPECRARGLCHEVLPELIDLDEWGYPIVRGPGDRRPARRRPDRGAHLPPARTATRRGPLTDVSPFGRNAGCSWGLKPPVSSSDLAM